MKNTIKMALLCAAGLFVSLSGASGQTKIEAESYRSLVTSDSITKVNDGQAIGSFDIPGEKLIYDVNVGKTGFYRFSIRYVSKTDGHLRIQTDDGSYSVYALDAFRLLGDDWEQLPINEWYEFPISGGPSFYLTAGTHTIAVINEDAEADIDFFLMQESDVTDKKVAFVKTVPSKVELMPGDKQGIYPIAYNASGEMVAAPVTWSGNAEDGTYKAGEAEKTDVVTVTVGGVSKEVHVVVEKPQKKREFVVSKHGDLNTSKGYVGDASGNKVCLMGTSLFWSCSAPLWWSKETIDYLVDKYNIQVIRLPAAIAPCGSDAQTSCKREPYVDTWNKDCYYWRPEYTRRLVDEVVKAAIENDIYVIIDFHEHKAQDWTALAQEFFAYFAKKWGKYPNVMYEIFNEPVDDNGTVVNYAKQIIPTIRAIDPDNIIIVGSAQFSRDPDGVTEAGRGQTNIAYTWHGYTQYGHQEDWRTEKAQAWNTSIPVVVTEWGLNASGDDGGLLDTFKTKGVIHCFWSMSNTGGEDVKWSVLKTGCFKKAGWTDEEMNKNGAFMLAQAKGWLKYRPTDRNGVGLSMTVCPDKEFSLSEKETVLTGSASGGTENYTYTWTQVKGPNQATIASPHAAETKVSGLIVGMYTFMLGVSDGEEELFDFVSIYPEGSMTGVPAVSSRPDFEVYPNPVKDGVITIVVSQKSVVSIFDVMGRLVSTTVAVPNMGNNVTLSGEGVYFVKSGCSVRKIIVL